MVLGVSTTYIYIYLLRQSTPTEKQEKNLAPLITTTFIRQLPSKNVLAFTQTIYNAANPTEKIYIAVTRREKNGGSSLPHWQALHKKCTSSGE